MHSPRDTVSLLSLPNEILLDILRPFRTPTLLPLASICHRVHNLVLRILTHRLNLAPSLWKSSLVLECYPPSRRLYESYMMGLYLGTDGLESLVAGLEVGKGPGVLLREINTMYSRFRPYRRVLERKMQWKHPAGDVPGSRTYGAATLPSSISMTTAASSSNPSAFSASNPRPGNLDEASGPASAVAHSHSTGETDAERQAPVAPVQESYETVTTQVHLDADDLFTQLCASVSISIPGPKPGIFHGFQDVDQDGVMRVWRKWLAERVAAGSQAVGPTHDDSDRGPARMANQAPTQQDPAILWINNLDHIGIRFGVQEKRWQRGPQPLLVGASDEDTPVSYELRYEELVVRTRDLLLASEMLHDQRYHENGKAIVFGTWL